MIRRAARLLRLDTSQKRALVSALVTIPWVSATLKWRGMGALVDSGPARRATKYPSRLEEARRLAAVVDIAARHGFVRASCLPTALTLQRLLARRGIDCDLRLGVRRNGGVMEAHAWIEHAGEALGEAGRHGQFWAFDPIAHKAGQP